MSTSPRVVLGMPAYGRLDTLPRTLESLLSQTYGDVAIFIVDDHPSLEVKALVESYAPARSAVPTDGTEPPAAKAGPRIEYRANPVRLGMTRNWRAAFEAARARYPESELFAWVSDHDVWHPRWLEAMVRAFDDTPGIVLAYPQLQHVFPTNRRLVLRLFDTVGMPTARRLRAALTEMTAGDCIYGLFRADALSRAGVFRPVLMPDKQLLVELAILGEFRHVPEVLWYREASGAFSYARQRRMFFPGRPPLHTYLPANLQHAAVIGWDFVIRGAGRPAFGRWAGAGWALRYLWASTTRELTRRDAWWRALLPSASTR